MSRPAFRRGGAASHKSRAAAEPPLVLRAKWRDLAELARRTARNAAAEQPLDRLETAQLSHQLNHTGAVQIPLEGVTAQHARTAFVAACRGLLDAAPDRRPILAELAAAAAVAVLALLDLEARKAAAHWHKQFGD
jgi:hypothetical protein